MDTPMLSKIERGERKAKREQVLVLAKLLEVQTDELLTLWLASRVYSLVSNEKMAIHAIRIVEENLSSYAKPNN